MKDEKSTYVIPVVRVVDTRVDLNFLQVQFRVEITQEEHFTEKGWDRVSFMISMNPGEPMRPLSEIASGGELSRIMLGIQSVMADSDEIGTLIFDEIDAGISGRTAQAVSEKIYLVAREHQVICITHLPQIAAMADEHFVIEKRSNQKETITDVRRLDEQDSLGELARLLGSDALTEAALVNAREMRGQALESKKELR